MRILVVCGAGASSTFVAQRLRLAASGQGLDHSVRAGTASSLADDIGTTDAVLVGPHLAASFDEIERIAAAHDAFAALLPADIFTDRSGERTLALLRDALAQRPTVETTPSGRNPHG